MNMNTSILDRT